MWTPITLMATLWVCRIWYECARFQCQVREAEDLWTQNRHHHLHQSSAIQRWHLWKSISSTTTRDANDTFRDQSFRDDKTTRASTLCRGTRSTHTTSRWKMTAIMATTRRVVSFYQRSAPIKWIGKRYLLTRSHAKLSQNSLKTLEHLFVVLCVSDFTIAWESLSAIALMRPSRINKQIRLREIGWKCWEIAIGIAAKLLAIFISFKNKQRTGKWKTKVCKTSPDPMHMSVTWFSLHDMHKVGSYIQFVAWTIIIIAKAIKISRCRRKLASIIGLSTLIKCVHNLLKTLSSDKEGCFKTN